MSTIPFLQKFKDLDTQNFFREVGRQGVFWIKYLFRSSKNNSRSQVFVWSFEFLEAKFKTIVQSLPIVTYFPSSKEIIHQVELFKIQKL